NGRVTGVRTQEGQVFNAGQVLVAAGAWTSVLVPELGPAIYVTGHPVFHLKVADPTLFKPPHFPVFTADIANSGWYGFPWHPHQNVIKIANHGAGQPLHPVHDKRIVNDVDIRKLHRFLESTFPLLKDATITYTRRCLYSDTLDGHFWIARHPQIDGLTVAAGGSGHAFKFAPILSDLIADALEGQPNPYLARFGWREMGSDTRSEEAARCQK
ncbi:MAG: FAD-dependent oxidoreductase, partial [Anaerolineales bacterium]|nr:FAD-dependent oxidoreductase [Anaerolineales bacterium]